MQHFYRADCSQYCLARNDNSGHYTCNPADGSKICNSGYEHPETNCVDCELSDLFRISLGSIILGKPIVWNSHIV